MKPLLTEHYEAIKARGLIHPGTSIHDFISKLEEEYYEFRSEYAQMNLEDITTPSKEMIQESVDLVMVIMDMFQHYGIDFKEELSENIKRQQSR
jgi:acyl carrier protein